MTAPNLGGEPPTEVLTTKPLEPGGPGQNAVSRLSPAAARPPSQLRASFWLWLLAACANHDVDEVGFPGDLPDIRGFLEKLVRVLYIRVHRANELLHFLVGGLPLTAHALGQRLCRAFFTLARGAREKLADMCINA